MNHPSSKGDAFTVSGLSESSCSTSGGAVEVRKRGKREKSKGGGAGEGLRKLETGNSEAANRALKGLVTSLILVTSPPTGAYTSLAAFTDSTDPNDSLITTHIRSGCHSMGWTSERRRGRRSMMHRRPWHASAHEHPPHPPPSAIMRQKQASPGSEADLASYSLPTSGRSMYTMSPRAPAACAVIPTLPTSPSTCHPTAEHTWVASPAQIFTDPHSDHPRRIHAGPGAGALMYSWLCAK